MTTHNTTTKANTMNLNQIEVISKLFYGDNFDHRDLQLCYEKRVKKMMSEDLEKFRSCEKKSNELGVHKDFTAFNFFMLNG